jgi:hypothetical protein
MAYLAILLKVTHEPFMHLLFERHAHRSATPWNSANNDAQARRAETKGNVRRPGCAKPPVIQILIPAKVGPPGAILNVHFFELVPRLDRGALWIKMEKKQHQRTPYGISHHGYIDAFANRLLESPRGVKDTSVHPNNAIGQV